MSRQFGVQFLPFLQGHAADFIAGIGGDEQRTPPTAVAVNPDHGMAYRRHHFALIRRDRRQLRIQAAAEFIVMDHMQRLEPPLHRFRQRVMGGEHVGELGLAALGAFRHHLDAVHDRGQRRDRTVGAVGMPAGVYLLVPALGIDRKSVV